MYPVRVGSALPAVELPSQVSQNPDTSDVTPTGSANLNRVLEGLSGLTHLISRTMDDVRTLDSEFEDRLVQTSRETTAFIREQARQQLDGALAEKQREIEEIFRQRIQNLTQQWDTERNRLNAEVDRLTKAEAAALNFAEGTIFIDRVVVNEEVQRLNDLIKDATRVIDDPEAELATVIRKNAERAQHECFLSGIRYVLAAQVTRK